MADLFDIVTARKLSGGGGGGTTVEALSVTQNGTYTAPSGKAYSPVTVNVSGGSSDFSTAEVTINDSSGKLTSFWGACIVDEDGDSWSTFQGNHSKSIVILYKGTAYIFLEAEDSQYSTSGDIVDDGDGYFYVTGDCTITIS